MIGIIDYGLGNVISVQAAVQRLGHPAELIGDPGRLGTADKLVLPGVGAFGDGMRNLRERGFVEPLTRRVMEDRVPFLGICLGFQLIARESTEYGLNAGLGWIDARVVRLTPADTGLRIPHVGWNGLAQKSASPLFREIPEDALFYYVHSYCMRPADSSVVTGECDYGGPFTASVGRDNIHAVQFHPEKSQRHGLKLLENFLTAA